MTAPVRYQSAACWETSWQAAAELMEKLRSDPVNDVREAAGADEAEP